MNRRNLVLGLFSILVGLCLTTTTQAADKLHIGVSIPSATHGWPAGVGWWAEQTMKEFPEVTWEFQRAGTAAEQAGQIDAMVEKGVGALVVLPFDSDTCVPSLKKAKAQGIYIVSVDRGLRDPIGDVYIAGDNKAFGKKSAEYMVEKLNGKGNIVILRGMPVEIDAERFDSAMEVFKAHPEIKVLGAQPGNWNKQDAHAVMQNFLTQFEKIDAVWASDDDMALGCEQAIREAGRSNDMWILGGAGMKQIVKKVMDKDPQYPADITYPPALISAGIVLGVAGAGDGNEKALYDKIPAHLKLDRDQLLAAPSKDTKQRSIKLNVNLVTPNNAKDFYFPDSVY